MSDTTRNSSPLRSTPAGSSPKMISPLTPSIASAPARIPISTSPCELFLALTSRIPSLGLPICPETTAMPARISAAAMLITFCSNTIIAFLAFVYRSAISLTSSLTFASATEALNSANPSAAQSPLFAITALARAFRNAVLSSVSTFLYAPGISVLASGVLITTTFAPATAACLILFQITAALLFMKAGTRITSVERSSSIVLGEASSPSTSRSALCLLLKLNTFAPRTSANFFIV